LLFLKKRNFQIHGDPQFVETKGLCSFLLLLRLGAGREQIGKVVHTRQLTWDLALTPELRALKRDMAFPSEERGPVDFCELRRFASTWLSVGIWF
jgi:hypothetical protein